MLVAPPAPADDDPEDVTWALSTAQALWKRAEYGDALVWVRRAARSASELGCTARYQVLAGAAAQIARQLRDAARQVGGTTSESSQLGQLPPSEFPTLRPGLPRPSVAEPPTIRPGEGGLQSPPSSLQRPDESVSGLPGGTLVPGSHPSRSAAAKVIPEMQLPLVDLASVEIFSELPDEARHQLEISASLRRLQPGEEASDEGVALVVRGLVGVMASASDAPATLLANGSLVPMRGLRTIDRALKLVAESSDGAVVARWSQHIIAGLSEKQAWVSEELLAVSDRLQALAGAATGRVGRGLDAGMLALTLERMEVRSLLPDEVWLRPGEVPSGLIIVGTGCVLIVGDQEQRVERCTAGGVVMASEVLTGASSVSCVRAASEGATVLYGSRKQVQELITACPPLLELLSNI